MGVADYLDNRVREPVVVRYRPLAQRLARLEVDLARPDVLAPRGAVVVEKAFLPMPPDWC
jgi:hypothetical protein